MIELFAFSQVYHSLASTLVFFIQLRRAGIPSLYALLALCCGGRVIEGEPTLQVNTDDVDSRLLQEGTPPENLMRQGLQEEFFSEPLEPSTHSPMQSSQEGKFTEEGSSEVEVKKNPECAGLSCEFGESVCDPIWGRKVLCEQCARFETDPGGQECARKVLLSRTNSHVCGLYGPSHVLCSGPFESSISVEESIFDFVIHEFSSDYSGSERIIGIYGPERRVFSAFASKLVKDVHGLGMCQSVSTPKEFLMSHCGNQILQGNEVLFDDVELFSGEARFIAFYDGQLRSGELDFRPLSSTIAKIIDLDVDSIERSVCALGSDGTVEYFSGSKSFLFEGKYKKVQCAPGTVVLLSTEGILQRWLIEGRRTEELLSGNFTSFDSNGGTTCLTDLKGEIQCVHNHESIPVKIDLLQRRKETSQLTIFEPKESPSD